jgi:hypothetical protein
MDVSLVRVCCLWFCHLSNHSKHQVRLGRRDNIMTDMPNNSNNNNNNNIPDAFEHILFYPFPYSQYLSTLYFLRFSFFLSSPYSFLIFYSLSFMFIYYYYIYSNYWTFYWYWKWFAISHLNIDIYLLVLLFRLCYDCQWQFLEIYLL